MFLGKKCSDKMVQRENFCKMFRESFLGEMLELNVTEHFCIEKMLRDTVQISPLIP